MHNLGKLGNKKLDADNILTFYKVPYAVYGSKSFLVLIRQALQDSIEELNNGNGVFRQSNALHLLNVYKANFESLLACRMNIKDIFEE